MSKEEDSIDDPLWAIKADRERTERLFGALYRDMREKGIKVEPIFSHNVGPGD